MVEENSNNRDISKSLVLIGMMGSGKTSVGTKLAAHLGVNFIDIDVEIERVSDMSISDIFSDYGEAEFRELETRVLRRILTEPPMVIATGGGVFISEKNRELIHDYATSVWLKADLDVLWDRVKGKTHRPLLNTENPRQTLENIMTQREIYYSRAQHHVQSFSGQTHEEMVARICKSLGITA